MRAVGQERRWLLAFGGATAPGFSILKLGWDALRTPEASPLDLVRIVQGSTFSVGRLWGALMDVNLIRDARRFEVPVFFALGRYDHQVVADVSAAYFEALEAPLKKLVWFERSGHFLPFEEPEAFNRLLIDEVRPLALS
jgi:pimeloyl-ACP methyl ester carboxylesterase